jgi:hypothetical protein
MADFILKQLPYDLSNQAGLALIGKYLKRINLNALVDPRFPVRSGIANSDVLKSYLGLLWPVRHAAQRRRICTVMQELMFKAARVIRHARQWVLGLGANDWRQARCQAGGVER